LEAVAKHSPGEISGRARVEGFETVSLYCRLYPKTVPVNRAVGIEISANSLLEAILKNGFWFPAKNVGGQKTF
jgi:hypothetical protein